MVGEQFRLSMGLIGERSCLITILTVIVATTDCAFVELLLTCRAGLDLLFYEYFA